MPSFAFVARDESGQPRSGVIDATNATTVASLLRGRGWIVVNLEEQADEGNSAPQSGQFLRFFRAPRSVHVELSLRQLAVMLRGGISLLSAMHTLASQSESRSIRRAYNDMIETVQSGRPFSEAVELQPGFPDFLSQLIRVGEQTGIQETVLVSAADMMKTRRETIRELATALMYPLLVLVAAVVATAFIVTNLLPKLADLLTTLNRPLPPMTRSLITISEFTTEWAGAIIGSSMLAALVFGLTWVSSPGRLFIDRLALRIPVVGKLFRISGTLTFSQTLGVLVGSGVTV
ncbi:MAG: type II secretion system F family protein, partial [Rubripirellula sp.]|nr:type II secretion system F family protein [Rubripirellula sp.]